MLLRAFTRQTLFASAGFLVWLVHFNVIYAMHALACARGIPGTTVVIGIATAVCLAATLLVLCAAVGRRPTSADAADEAGARFLRFLAAAAAIGGSIAIVWEALPVLLIRPCA